MPYREHSGCPAYVSGSSIYSTHTDDCPSHWSILGRCIPVKQLCSGNKERSLNSMAVTVVIVFFIFVGTLNRSAMLMLQCERLGSSNKWVSSLDMDQNACEENIPLGPSLWPFRRCSCSRLIPVLTVVRMQKLNKQGKLFSGTHNPFIFCTQDSESRPISGRSSSLRERFFLTWCCSQRARSWEVSSASSSFKSHPPSNISCNHTRIGQ